MQSLLTESTNLFSPPETHFFPSIVPDSKFKYFNIASRNGRKKVLLHMNAIGCPMDPINSFFLHRWIFHFKKTLDDLALKNKSIGWIEKTPKHLHYLSYIHQYMPNAKIVHLVRNGLDVSASLFEASNNYPKAWGGSRSPRACAERWVHDIKISFSKLSCKNHKIITYEDLTLNTDNTLSDIKRFLYLPETSNYSQTNSEQQFNSLVLVSEPWKKYHSGVRLSKGKANKVFSPQERSIVLEIVNQVKYSSFSHFDMN